ATGTDQSGNVMRGLPSVRPRASGDPVNRGPSVWPWVPACAGTNGEDAPRRDRSSPAGILTATLVLLFATAALAQAPMPAAKIQVVPFDTTPFPYTGIVPDKGMPFLDVVNGERRGHTSLRGGVYWEEATYSDKRVLLSIPRGFDLRRPALSVVYFHGNLATLTRDVRDRQQIPRQLEQSGLNAVLVAPQFAVNAADSSSGRFWEPGVFGKFLDEPVGKPARPPGDPRRGAGCQRGPPPPAR